MNFCDKKHHDNNENTTKDKTEKAIIRNKNKSSILQLLPFYVILLSLSNSLTDDISYNAFSSLQILKGIMYGIITMPEHYITALILVAAPVFSLLYEHIKNKKAVKAALNGDSPDERNRKKRLFIFNIAIIASAAIFISLSVYSYFSNTKYEIPEFSESLYLDVHDFGIADKITGTGHSHGNKYIPNKITHRKTLSAQMWITDEHYDIDDKTVYIYQDIIRYKSHEVALYATELLTSERYKDYTETQAEGFEKVYSESENLVAVAGNTVYRLTYITTQDSPVPTSEQLLDAILANNKNLSK